MRSDHHHDNFSRNTIDVASNNRLSVKSDLLAACSPAITITVVFCILLLTTALVYLALDHMILLTIIVIGLPILGCFLLLFKAINYIIRETAKTRAVCSYHKAQHLRNAVVEAKPGIIVLHDPYGQFRGINAREVSENYHYNEKPPTQISDTPEDFRKRPPSFSHLLQGIGSDYANDA